MTSGAEPRRVAVTSLLGGDDVTRSAHLASCSLTDDVMLERGVEKASVRFVSDTVSVRVTSCVSGVSSAEGVGSCEGVGAVFDGESVLPRVRDMIDSKRYKYRFVAFKRSTF